MIRNINRLIFNLKAKKIKKKIRTSNFIWHFCTPKSASTYLKNIFINKNFTVLPAVPFYRNRPQVTDINELYKNLTLSNFKDNVFTSHQHSLFDDYISKYISKKHKVIIQTRNIYETICSLRDQIIKEKIYDKNPFCILHKNMTVSSMNKNIILNYTPFHVKFVISWYNSKIEAEKLFINYKEFINNEKNFLKLILNDDNFDLKNNDLNKIKKSSRYLRGLNREINLSKNEIALCDDIVKSLTKSYNKEINNIIYQK